MYLQPPTALPGALRFLDLEHFNSEEGGKSLPFLESAWLKQRGWILSHTGITSCDSAAVLPSWGRQTLWPIQAWLLPDLHVDI